MKKSSIFIFAIFMISFQACETDKDDQSPSISLSLSDAFPENCDTIYMGEAFTFKAEFNDNVELGSYSLDIHNNFDHHTHSTEPSECELDPVKIPQSPWVFIQQYNIPEGSSTFLANNRIDVPDSIDPGDYHFYIRLTDKSGWQTIKGISIKILEK